MFDGTPLIDEAIPLVRNEAWSWHVRIWDDPDEEIVTDLTGLDCLAMMRWAGGSQAVTVDAADAVNGHLVLSLLAADADAMPIGRLTRLYLSVEGDTELIADINVIEGYTV
jgi:hypothetical protein